MATVTKDMLVANLVEPWRGDNNSIPVVEFFESINEADEMERLRSKDMIRLTRLKLRGTARVFYSAQAQLKAYDVTYEEFRARFVNRFKHKHTDRYHYVRVQNTSQEKKCIMYSRVAGEGLMGLYLNHFPHKLLYSKNQYSQQASIF
jgi:hypothetical protein